VYREAQQGETEMSGRTIVNITSYTLESYVKLSDDLFDLAAGSTFELLGEVRAQR
jgi:hypothetical protein